MLIADSTSSSSGFAGVPQTPPSAPDISAIPQVASSSGAPPITTSTTSGSGKCPFLMVSVDPDPPFFFRPCNHHHHALYPQLLLRALANIAERLPAKTNNAQALLPSIWSTTPSTTSVTPFQPSSMTKWPLSVLPPMSCTTSQDC